MEQGLTLRKKNELSTGKGAVIPVYTFNYQLLDAAHYAFFCDVDEKVNVVISESEQQRETTSFVDAELEDQGESSNKLYYAVAAACGFFTGSLATTGFLEKALTEAHDYAGKDLERLIVFAANRAGYKKDSYKGAVQFILHHAVIRAGNRDAANGQKWGADLAANPSIAGLLFSMVTQFTQEQYSFGEKDRIISASVPEYYAIGEDVPTKIIYALLYWAFNLAVAATESARPILDEIGIDNGLLQILKEIIDVPVFQNLPESVEEAERSFSEWMISVFQNQADTCTDESREFDLRALIIEIKEEIDTSFPVLLNESLFRGFYLLHNLYLECKALHVTSFQELKKIDASKVLPLNNRTISRMSVIASGTFVCANLISAAKQALQKKKKKNQSFADVFWAEISYVGIGRFIFAIGADSKYWQSDFKVRFERATKAEDQKKASSRASNNDVDIQDVLKGFSLDPLGTRILYSLEAISVCSDIKHTEKPEIAERKQQWLDEWKRSLLKEFAATEDFFITDEDVIYDGLYKLNILQENRRWLYLLSMEMALFDPYHALGTDHDSKYKKLKESYDYSKNEFVRRQTLVKQEEFDQYKKLYAKYQGVVSGRTKTTLISAGSTVAVAVAAGTLAFTFAPAIAVALAGDAVLGLHGVALTNASLALLGGGSLAAGGLGMAGGTAVITGGASLVGLLSSGSATVTALMLQTPAEYWLRQSSKILTFSDSVLCGALSDIKTVEGLIQLFQKTKEDVSQKLSSIEAEENELDKDLIKNTKTYIKYLERTEDSLRRIAGRVK